MVVAVSVDAEKAKVAPFIAKNQYTFPVLFGDGKIESVYNATALPKTYVIDGTGMIRFHTTGFIARHFQESIDWMVEAASH